MPLLEDLATRLTADNIHANADHTKGCGLGSIDVWGRPSFVLAAAAQRALAAERHALSFVTAWQPDSEALYQSSLISPTPTQRTLKALGVPFLPIRVVAGRALERNARCKTLGWLSMDIGLALCAMPPKDLVRLASWRMNWPLTQWQGNDVRALMLNCLRLGWDREIDDHLKIAVPSSAQADGQLDLTSRVRQEVWQIIDAPILTHEPLMQCIEFAVRVRGERPLLKT